MAFKSLNNLAPTYLKTLLEKNPCSNYSLRKTPYLNIPKHSTNMYKFSYSVQAAKIINELTQNKINTELKISEFKNKTFYYYFNNMN